MIAAVEAPHGDVAAEPDDAPPTADRAAGAPDVGWVLGAAAALFGLVIGLAPLHDNSFFTHLATGRLILEEGGVPRVDPYSFTANGEPWTAASWLASVIYAGVEDVASAAGLSGFAGIRLLNGVLCAAIAVVLWLLTARSRSLAIRAVVTLAALVVMSDMLPGRPLLFGLLGLGLVFLAADERLDPRWLVPVGYLWVNTHGSFPFAALLLGLLALGGRLDEGRWGSEVKVGLWTALGLALGIVSPLGAKPLVYPTLLAQRTEAFEAIAEWQPPDYTHWYQVAVVVFLVVAAALLVLRHRRWRDILPTAVFAAAALTSARNQSALVLVLTAVVAGAAPEVGPAVASVRRSILRPARVVMIALIALFTVAALQSQPDVQLAAYPEASTTWMEDNGMWGPGSRVVAPDYVGNFRTLQAGRDARVFIDDRVDMYPVPLIRDYLTLLRAEPGWQDVLEDRQATAVLWRSDTDLGRALAQDDGWEVVHRDAPWVVWVPASPR